MSFLKKFINLIKPFHKPVTTLLILLIIYEGQQMLNSYFPSIFITLFQTQAQVKDYALIFALSTLNQFIFIFLDNYIDYFIISRLTYPIFKYLKTTALQKFLEMDMAWHQQNNSGVLIGKIDRGVDKVSDLLNMMYWEFVPTSIQVVWTIIALILFNNLWTVLISAITLIFFIILTYRGFKIKKPLKEERHTHYEEDWRLSQQVVRGAETYLMFGQKENMLDEYENIHQKIIDLGNLEARQGVYVDNRWRLFVLTIANQLIWFIWVLQLHSGVLTLPGLFYVNNLKERLFHSFWRFARLLEKGYEASESIDRYVDLIAQQTAIPDDGLTFNIPRPIGIILNDFSFQYPSLDKEDESNGALEHLDLIIPPGEIVALVGPSGAGKTTIRRIITGMWRGEGEVLVGGHDVKDWSLSSLLKLFSYVPQGDDVYIRDHTVSTNIKLSRPTASDQEMMEAAKLAGIHDFICSLHKGYDTIVGEEGVRLSGGQKQRVALARAILADRPILILDEATSAIDAITEREIQNQMRQILKGKTAIIIAHRLSTIWDIADKIVVMENGRIIKEGSHEELVANCDLYSTMVELQTHA